MAKEPDDIRAHADCPKWGSELNVTYLILKLDRTVESHGCGATIRLIDETPICAVQHLIDDVDK